MKKSPSKIRAGTQAEWIAMLKGELTERSTALKEPKKQVVVKAPFKSLFKEEDEKNRKSGLRPTPNWQQQPIQMTSLPLSPPAKSNSSSNLFGLKYTIKSRCLRCRQQVAIVDRVQVSGCLFHRACLTCSKCGVTLRLSEFKCNDKEGAGTSSNGSSNGSLCSGIENNFSYLCILCLKNKANQTFYDGEPSFGNGFHPLPKTGKSSPLYSAQNHHLSTSSPSIHKINGSNVKQLMKTDVEVSSKLPPLSPSRVRKEVVEDQPEECLNGYEMRLRERMKWKANFLMNNNSLDLGSILKENERRTEENSLSKSPTSHVVTTKKITTVADGGQSGSYRNGMGPNQEIATKVQPTDISARDDQSLIEGSQKVESTKGDGRKVYSSSFSNTSSTTTTTTSSPFSDPSSPVKKNVVNNSDLHETISSPKINERIEYENTSLTYELLDDDEMTKLLNLECDRWGSDHDADDDEEDDDEDVEDASQCEGICNTSSGKGHVSGIGRGPVTTHELSSPLTNSSSWQKSSDDSTSNDFDSDEFDASEAITSPSRVTDTKLNIGGEQVTESSTGIKQSTTRSVQGRDLNVTGKKSRESKGGEKRRKSYAINQAENREEKSFLRSSESSPRRQSGNQAEKSRSSTTTSPSHVPEISIEYIDDVL